MAQEWPLEEILLHNFQWNVEYSEIALVFIVFSPMDLHILATQLHERSSKAHLMLL